MSRVVMLLLVGLVLGAIIPVLSFVSVLAIAGTVGVLLLLRNRLNSWVQFAFFLLPLTIPLPGTGVEVADIGLIVGLAALLVLIVSNKLTIRVDVAAALLFLLLAWGVVGYLNGSSFLGDAALNLNIFRIVRFAAYVLLYVFLYTFAQNSVDKWMAVIRFVVLGAALGGAISGLQYIFGYGTHLMAYYGGERVAPILGSVNGSAVVEATTLVIGLTLYITGNWFRGAWTWWPTAAALAFGQIVTFSRTAWLGSLIGVLILFGPAVGALRVPRMWKRWVTFVLVATLATIALSARIPSVQERVIETFRPQSWSSYSSVDLGGRESFWADAVEAWKQHVFLGTGFYSSFSHPAIPEGGTHSQYLAILVDGGLIGLLLFVSFLALPMKLGLSLSLDKAANSSQRVLGAGLGGALGSLAIMLFAGEFLYAPQTALLCLMIAGAISRLSVGSKSAMSDRVAAKGEAQ